MPVIGQRPPAPLKPLSRLPASTHPPIHLPTNPPTHPPHSRFDLSSCQDRHSPIGRVSGHTACDLFGDEFCTTPLHTHETRLVKDKFVVPPRPLAEHLLDAAKLARLRSNHSYPEKSREGKGAGVNVTAPVVSKKKYGGRAGKNDGGSKGGARGEGNRGGGQKSGPKPHSRKHAGNRRVYRVYRVYLVYCVYLVY